MLPGTHGRLVRHGRKPCFRTTTLSGGPSFLHRISRMDGVVPRGLPPTKTLAGSGLDSTMSIISVLPRRLLGRRSGVTGGLTPHSPRLVAGEIYESVRILDVEGDARRKACPAVVLGSLHRNFAAAGIDDPNCTADKPASRQDAEAFVG